jgi:hypothetical protein
MTHLNATGLATNPQYTISWAADFAPPQEYHFCSREHRDEGAQILMRGEHIYGPGIAVDDGRRLVMVH